MFVTLYTLTDIPTYIARVVHSEKYVVCVQSWEVKWSEYGARYVQY
jgi:hypothetical protein